MKKLKCYYAHPMMTYGSTIEEKDLNLLEQLGFEVINPNCEEHQEGCKLYALSHGVKNIMQYFEDIVKTCDVVAFRALPDGNILSGCAAEIQEANRLNLPVIELPRQLEKRFMNYPDTKQYLIESGHYKKL